MRFRLLMLAALPLAMTGCAYKGKLKTPSQIAHEAEKKKRAAEKEERRAAEQEKELAPPASTSPPEAK